MTLVPRRVQHCGNHDKLLSFDNLVDDAIRETLRITPTDVLAWMLPAIEERILRNGVEHMNHRLTELTAQTRLPGLIPSGGLGNVALHLGTHDDAPVHESER